MKQREILILTGRFGMGHCCVAEAIRQQLVKMDSEISVRVVDLIEKLFPNSSTMIYCSFAQMVNHCPSVYNQLNKMAGKCNTFMQIWVAEKMKRLLAGVETVVSTFPMCSQFAAAYKQKYHTSLKLYTYITDIGAQDEWIVSGTDLYFVGAEETKLELMVRGVPAQSIHVCGIPVRQDFLYPAQDVRKKQTEILLMGGGLGLLPSVDVCLSALEQCKTVHVTVITGKNYALYSKLRAQYPNITVVGYTEQVAHYMQQADLLVTKSGGATTFEAIYSETPLYILQPYLMQEFANAQFIEQHQIGCVAGKKTQTIPQDILGLAQDVQRLHTMKQHMQQLKHSWEAVCPAMIYGRREGQAVS